MTDPKDVPFSPSEFASVFKTLQPAILTEWPEVDAAALADTDGDLDSAVTLIAQHTEHTKTLVRLQLEELYRISLVVPPRHRAAAGYQIPESVDALLHDLEKRAAQILRDLRGGALQDARNKVTDNLFLSLLISVGLGFIVGVFFMGRGRDK